MKKIFRSDFPIELTILLVILTILLAFIIVPFLLIVGICRLVRFLVPGHSHDGLCPHEEPSRQDRAVRDDGRDEGSASAGETETIDCEVISSRTFDENGQEIR